MRRRDEDVLRRVYEDHVDAVYAFFAYAVRREQAEDLTASTFERVIRAWRRYDPSRAAERTWVLSIARNLLTDHYRRESHRRGVSLDEHPVILDTLRSDEDWAERRLDQDELRSWLAVLTERERDVLALRYGADLPAADIAALLDLSAANVHQIVSRALRRLRETASSTNEPAPG